MGLGDRHIPKRNWVYNNNCRGYIRQYWDNGKEAGNYYFGCSVSSFRGSTENLSVCSEKGVSDCRIWWGFREAPP